MGLLNLLYVAPLLLLVTWSTAGDPFTYSQSVALGFAYALTACLTLNSLSELPKFSRLFVGLFCLTLLLPLLNILAKGGEYDFEAATCDRVTFFVMIFSSALGFIRVPKFSTGLAYSSLIFTGICATWYWLAQFFFTPLFESYGGFAFFGNANLFSQALVFAQLPLLIFLKHERRTKYFSIVVLSLGNAAILRELSRSTALALLGAGTIVFILLVTRRKMILQIVGTSLLFYFVSMAAIPYRRSEIGPSAVDVKSVPSHLSTRFAEENNRWWAQLTAKKYFSYIRRDYLQTSLNLFGEHPNGYGYSQFPWVYASAKVCDLQLQSEAEIVESPHNELARLLVEEGWLGASLLIFTFLTFVLVSLYGSYKERDKEGFVFLAATIAALLIEASFQFPFSVPAPQLFMALALGRALMKLPRASVSSLTSAFIKTICVIALITQGARFASLLTSKTRWDTAGFFCSEFHVLPFVECESFVLAQIAAGHYLEANRVLDSWLSKQSLNFVFHRLRATTAFASGDLEKGCLETEFYNQSFPGENQLTEVSLNYCKNIARLACPL